MLYTNKNKFIVRINSQKATATRGENYLNNFMLSIFISRKRPYYKSKLELNFKKVSYLSDTIKFSSVFIFFNFALKVGF